MSSEIRIEIPEHDSEMADLITYFQERLPVLAEALDCDVADFDERAQIDAVCIKSADVDGDSISITCELRFSAFYACSDIKYAGSHQRVILGRRYGGFWVFSPHRSIPPRSTHEEF